MMGMAQNILNGVGFVENKSTYETLKKREEELLAQLKELKEQIANAENDIIEEKLNIALQCLADVDKMTSGYYRCTVETYCEGCEENIDIDIDLAEIIEALRRMK